MNINVGTKVFLNSPLPFLKTSDPMPMLRPPDLVSVEEAGMVVALKGVDTVEVKFRRGTFLIPIEKLSVAVENKD